MFVVFVPLFVLICRFNLMKLLFALMMGLMLGRRVLLRLARLNLYSDGFSDLILVLFVDWDCSVPSRVIFGGRTLTLNLALTLVWLFLSVVGCPDWVECCVDRLGRLL